MSKLVTCIKYKKELEGFESPPTMGKVGKLAQEKLSKDGWDLWLTLQMIIINEQQLALNSDQTVKYLESLFVSFLETDELEKEYHTKLVSQNVLPPDTTEHLFEEVK